MPEPARMIPPHTARLRDLRAGFFISVTCPSCHNVKELAVNHLRGRLPPDTLVSRLGPQFRCQRCGHRGAEVAARLALAAAR